MHGSVPLKKAASSQVPPANPDPLVATGFVKWFNQKKGFGFVVPDDGRSDVLLHVTCLKEFGRETVQEGAIVRCSVLRRSQGLYAVSIIEISESAASSPPASGGKKTA